MSEAEEVALDDLEDELLMEESLTPMERISKFSNSGVMIHRLLVARELPNTIHEYSVPDAVDQLLPIVLKLSVDHDDTVRETFVRELDRIVLYYYQHAPPIPGASDLEDDPRTLKTTSPVDETLTEQEVPMTISVPAPSDDQEKAPKSAAIDEADATVSHDKAPTISATTSCETDATYIPSSPIHHPASESTSHEHQHIPHHTFAPVLAEEHCHLPHHAFVPILIDLLLDQNSTIASLGQQCIASVATELVSSPESMSLVDSEIIDGVVTRLLSIADGKQRQKEMESCSERTESESEMDDQDPGSRMIRRRSSTSGFETSPQLQPSSEEIDQGEVNLAKMMCLSLLSALAPALGPDRCVKLSLPIIERMADDRMFYVRKEAAAAIGSLAPVLEQSVIMDKLLPLYDKFSVDPIWHVRRSCVLSLPTLCAALPEEEKTRIVVEAVNGKEAYKDDVSKSFKDDVSRNVRGVFVEIVGELIVKFLPDDWETTGKPGKVPEPLLDYFLSLGTDSAQNQAFKLDQDRFVICAYNFPAVALTAGADYWDSRLREVYLSLTKDYQIKVRRTFAYSLHEVARIIGPERTERDLVQIFALYLMDLDEVKQGVLEHLAEFLGTLAVSSRNEYIPILAEVWDGVMTNWRLRDILTAQLRDIAMLFDAARVVEHVLPLAIQACNDKFAAVRETVVEAFPVILDIVKRAVDENGETLSQAGDDDYEDDEESSPEDRRHFAEELLRHVLEKLDEFVQSDRYRSRIVFSHLCGSLLQAGISAGDFATFFLPNLLKLAHDPVVNVRIAASRTLRSLYLNDAYMQELGDGVLPELDRALYSLALDRDDDVRSFVLDLVDPGRLMEMGKERQEHVETTAEPQETLVHPSELPSSAATPMQEVEEPTAMATVEATPMTAGPTEDQESIAAYVPDTSMDYSDDTMEGDEDELMTESEPVSDTDLETTPEAIPETTIETALTPAPETALEEAIDTTPKTIQETIEEAPLPVAQQVEHNPAMNPTPDPVPIPASALETPVPAKAENIKEADAEVEMNVDSLTSEASHPPPSSGEENHT